MTEAVLDQSRSTETNEPDLSVPVSKLASGLAHEMKNPISAIMMGAKLLRRSLAVYRRSNCSCSTPC